MVGTSSRGMGRWDPRVRALALVSLASALLLVAARIHRGIPIAATLVVPAFMCVMVWGALAVAAAAARRPVHQLRDVGPHPRLHRLYHAIALVCLALAVYMVWLPVAVPTWWVDVVVMVTSVVPFVVLVRLRLHGW